MRQLPAKTDSVEMFRASLLPRAVATGRRSSLNLTRLPSRQVSGNLPRSSLSGFHPRSYGIGGRPAGREQMCMADLVEPIRVEAVVRMAAATIRATSRRA